MQRDLNNTLRITEIFYSIQGESATVGWPTVFIRLTGCPLRCQYCDTAYAFTGGTIYTLEDIVERTKQLHAGHYDNRHITITGGEPLAQVGCKNLIAQLCELGYKVSIETSGAFDISSLDHRLMIVMDLKTPDSKECDKNLWKNVEHLKPQDQIKFVICSDQDYLWAKNVVLEQKLYQKCQILFSPSYKQVSLRDLAEKVLADNLPVRLQTQLHKHIWGEEQGR